MPEEMRARLESDATKAGRSLNAHIVLALQERELANQDAAVLKTELAKARQTIAEQNQMIDKSIDYGEHIEKSNVLRQLAAAKDLQLQNQSMFFDLLCAVVPAMFE